MYKVCFRHERCVSKQMVMIFLSQFSGEEGIPESSGRGRYSVLEGHSVCDNKFNKEGVENITSFEDMI